MTDHSGASKVMPVLVETPEAMFEMIRAFEGADSIAIDIESNGYYNYFERTCILSISTPDDDFVVDSLAIWDEMEPLREVLCDQGKRILVHGGSYDVLSLKRDFGFTFPRIMDSLPAATLLGFDVLGLAGLAKKYLGVELPKELQRHNWTIRPLLDEQLCYLGNDTRFLFPIVEQLESEIRESDLVEELGLECEFLAAQDYVEKPFFPEESVEKIKDSRKLPPNVRGILRGIFAWRDKLAREIDIAPFRVLANNVILAIARNPSTDPSVLRERRGVGRYVFDSGVDRLASAIASGMESPFPYVRTRGERPTHRRNYDEMRLLSKAIKAWRNEAALERGIGIQGVLPTPAMKTIVDLLPSDVSEIADVPRLGAKRIERYGETIIDLVARYCPTSLHQKASTG